MTTSDRRALSGWSEEGVVECNNIDTREIELKVPDRSLTCEMQAEDPGVREVKRQRAVSVPNK